MYPAPTFGTASYWPVMPPQIPSVSNDSSAIISTGMLFPSVANAPTSPAPNDTVADGADSTERQVNRDLCHAQMATRRPVPSNSGGAGNDRARPSRMRLAVHAATPASSMSSTAA